MPHRHGTAIEGGFFPAHIRSSSPTFSHKGFERTRVQGGLSVCKEEVLFQELVLRIVMAERKE